jgi:hypothetical protein
MLFMFLFVTVTSWLCHDWSRLCYMIGYGYAMISHGYAMIGHGYAMIGHGYAI